MIGAVPEEKATRGASRYDAVIATLVGFCALCVSGYTAYMQRQQVCAAVWPILEFDSSNAPDIHFTLANKGVGPAIIRHVIVKVDDQPVRNWAEALEHQRFVLLLYCRTHNHFLIFLLPRLLFGVDDSRVVRSCIADYSCS